MTLYTDLPIFSIFFLASWMPGCSRNLNSASLGSLLLSQKGLSKSFELWHVAINKKKKKSFMERTFFKNTNTMLYLGRQNNGSLPRVLKFGMQPKQHKRLSFNPIQIYITPCLTPCNFQFSGTLIHLNLKFAGLRKIC